MSIKEQSLSLFFFKYSFSMKINYLELKRVTAMHAHEIQQAVNHVVNSGWYLQGEAVGTFEAEYAKYCGAQHCVGCANGLDALTLTFRTLITLGRMEEGDEVIVPANTYIASILSVTENRLTPVLVEPRLNTFQIDDRLIEQAITARTRAILVVNLYGRNALTDTIIRLCTKYNLQLVIDNAQGHGLSLPHGTLHSAALPSPSVVCHSFYPGKNLGALGDGGAITTDDETLATLFRTIANYGSSRKYVFDYCGRNSRLDELQAAVLSVKLKYLDADNALRRNAAQRLIGEVSNPLITMPSAEYCHDNVFHIFPVLVKSPDTLQRHLQDHGIGTMRHYPIPPHQQACYQAWAALHLPITEQIHREEVSIPCNQTLTTEELTHIIFAMNSYDK